MKQLGLRRTYPLGVMRDGQTVALIGRETYGPTAQLVLAHHTDHGFQPSPEHPSIVLPLGRHEHLPHISDVRLSRILDQRIMTYTAGRNRQLHVAVRHDAEGLNIWDVPSINRHLVGSGMVVGEYRHDGQCVLFYGDGDIRVAFSKNLVAWHAGPRALAAPRKDQFDHRPLQIVAALQIEAGLLVVYAAQHTSRGHTTIVIGSLLCSASDPEQVLWRSSEPLAEYSAPSRHEPRLLGAVAHGPVIALYLSSETEKIITLECANPYAPRTKARRQRISLHRAPANPVLSPRIHEWESQAVLNPAAFIDQDRVHLLYRAMGPDGVSRLGYASSADGVHFDERLEHPVYAPHQGFGGSTTSGLHGRRAYDVIANPSGGGWAGCEDPRAVVIDGQVYLSYVAFDGWNFVRQALTALPLDSLRAKTWRWRQPVLISRPGEIQKNWVIFPEKINGRYAILHGLSPKIHIEYVDSLDQFDGQTFIDSLPPAHGQGYHDPGRRGHWDVRVRGCGAPPLRTSMGWLLLYHANDQHDPGKYKLGAMLLDLNDPTKVLFRSNAPILEPTEWYENDGKPGVIYTCGAVILGDNLIVYYGGGDKHIAIARANAKAFIAGLAQDHAVALTRAAGVS